MKAEPLLGRVDERRVFVKEVGKRAGEFAAQPGLEAQPLTGRAFAALTGSFLGPEAGS